MRISQATRRDIIDTIIVEGIVWSGRLPEQEFLDRVFSLEKLPSHDSRFSNALGDIYQHRVNNNDWDDDWVFSDPRFDLMEVDDEVFLRFLCEMLHPVVRDDGEQVEHLRRLLNEILRRDGCELTERTRISGRPVFSAQTLTLANAVGLRSIRDTFDGADTNYVARQITRMQVAIDTDPDLAIGTAKELVETCCKTILHERRVDIDGAWDLPQLVKSTARCLSLAPEDIPDNAKAVQTIRRLLSNLATITQGVAELRNQYGTGHGRGASTKGLQPRHAKLVVGAASTLAVFLLETHHVRRQPANAE